MCAFVIAVVMAWQLDVAAADDIDCVMPEATKACVAAIDGEVASYRKLDEPRAGSITRSTYAARPKRPATASREMGGGGECRLNRRR